MGDRIAGEVLVALGIADLRMVIGEKFDEGASTFTEAGPRPGSAVPDDVFAELTPEITAAQGADVDITTQRAGLPGRGGCELAYKLSADPDDQHRGWDAPNSLQGWSSLVFATPTVFDRMDAVTVPSSQKVVASFNSPLGASFSSVFDPDTWLWTPGGSYGGDYVCLLILPGSERILLNSSDDIEFSDDLGTTWQRWAVDPFDGIATAGWTRRRWDLHRNNVSMWVEKAAGDMVQLASNDLATTFVEIATHAALGSSVDVNTLLDGSLLVSYIRDADGFPVVVQLPSAFADLSEFTEIAIGPAVAVSDLVVIPDPDGTLYAYVRQTASPEILRILRSVDSGLTWTFFSNHAFDTGQAADFPTNFAAATVHGGVLLLHNWTADVGVFDGSIGSMLFGGWHSITQAQATGATPPGRDSWTTMWVPMERPSDGGHWAVSGAGTDVLVAPGLLKVDTIANRRDQIDDLGALVDIVDQQFEMRCDVGGILTATHVGFRCTVADGATHDVQVEIRFKTDSFRVFDVHGAAAVGADVVVDMTVLRQFRVELDFAGNLRTYHRLPGQWNWTVGPAAVITDKGAAWAATSEVRWGHIIAGTATSHWRMFTVNASAGAANTLLKNGAANVLGKPITSVPVPIPDAGTALRVARLRCRSGPARKGDSWQIAARFDGGIANLFLLRSPSPATPWEGTGTAEAIFRFDLDAPTWIGGSIALLFANVNFKTAFLESSTDAIGWTIEGTYNGATGFEAVGFIRPEGNMIERGAGAGANGGRLIQENEFAGGHWVLPGPIAVAIDSQDAGSWSAGTTTKQCKMRLATAVGAPVTGVGDLVASGGLLVVNRTAPATLRRYWRIRIPTQPCPDAAFRGNVLVTAVKVFGQAPSWTWQKEMQLNVRETRNRFGTIRKKEQGPPPIRWAANWADVVDQSQLRKGVDRDFLSPGAAEEALAVYQDVWTFLWGVIEQLKSGEVPCVAFYVPSGSGGTITDRTLYLYGLLNSSGAYNNIVGKEGVDEAGRIETIEIVSVP